MTPTPSASQTAESPTSDGTSTKSLTAKRGPGKPFVKGDERANLAGRPRKGESLPERLAKAYESKAQKLVDAAVARALRDDQVGNRAFNDGLDRVYGKVADEMHITTEDSPLLGFLMRHTAQLPGDHSLIVEGEVRQLPDSLT